MEYQYDIMSPIAEEFINDREIQDTMEYAKANCHNSELVFSLLERAEDCKGLTHREAAVLLECSICPIIVSMAVHTAPITDRTDISGEKSCPKRKSGRK